MTATAEDAQFVFTEWHRRISERDADGLAALYLNDATIESPLVTRVLDDLTRGIVQGRHELDRFVNKVVAARPVDGDLPSLYRTGDYMFDGTTLIWEYPRETPTGDQLDLIEVLRLDGPLIAHHRIYWGWKGVDHVVLNAVDKAAGTRP
ncbi:nuclear transport factor 2 family protein [Tessaracoccus antarcticus]|uniref:Nuclear transport factor 2 family protein n=1 Tax=Tessaracoccus antarcticus TaxID=2479848 RepID=A0A3M0FYL5_9ACTN|nr:nuclear transport factor 2 family protein [Tessaracoccus antarcticus]RMB57830.1 nuclear transport factor 2 family protein [Tessaracoccus antarcticus]